jgi:hypothetical protein
MRAERALDVRLRDEELHFPRGIIFGNNSNKLLTSGSFAFI